MRPTEQTSEPIGDDMARRHGRSAFRALKAHAWCVPRTGLRPLRIAVVVVLGALAVACDDHPNASAQPATSASAPSAAAHTDAASADAMAAEDEQLAYDLLLHHRHHHTGFAGFVFMAVETIGPNSEQEAAIGKINDELKAKMRPFHVANAVVTNLLADGVASGNIDKAKVDAEVAKAALVGTEVYPAVGAALVAIHKLFKPEQRQALVDKVDSNWALWKEANAGEQAADDAKPEGCLSHVAKDLSLTHDQVAKFKANLDGEKSASKPFDVTAEDADMKAFSRAFLTDTFDVHTLPPADENAKLLSWGAERMARFYEAMTPVLTPDQRTKVADQLREHAREPLAEGTP